MKYLCKPQNARLCRCVIVNFTVTAFICLFFCRQFWSFKKPIARMQVASTLRNNNGERESISLLQILRKMVRINYCGNFTTFSITLVSPIEISVLKQSLIWRRFLSLHSLSSLIIRLLKIHIPQSLIKLSILCLLCCCLITFFGWFLGVLKDQWWLRVCTRICMTYSWQIKS